MLQLLKNEIYKLLRRKKFQILLLLIPIIELVAIMQYKMNSVSNLETAINGQSFFLTIASSLQYAFVICTAVFVTDAFMDDYLRGTLKNTLLRGVKRVSLLHVKIISMSVFLSALMLFAVLSSYVLGTAFFGFGEYTAINGAVYDTVTGFGITLLSAFLILIPLFSFGILIVFIGLITNNVGITIGSALSITLITQIMESSQIIRQYSIVYQIKGFYQHLLYTSKFTDALADFMVITMYMIVFYLASVLIFRKKDLGC